VAMRWFGHSPHIVLMAFGGYAATTTQSREPWKRLVIAFAGPLAGFTLLFGTIALAFVVPVANDTPLAFVFTFLIWMNLFWNLLNLLPIWPLDGGRVCRELCTMARIRRAEEVTLQISLVVAAGIALFGLLLNLGVLPQEVASSLPFYPGWMMTLFMGMFAYQNYEMLQIVKRRSRWEQSDPWS
jgi:stage IV sporulation protein FB